MIWSMVSFNEVVDGCQPMAARIFLDAGHAAAEVFKTGLLIGLFVGNQLDLGGAVGAVTNALRQSRC